jgi:hypothetical protein
MAALAFGSEFALAPWASAKRPSSALGAALLMNPVPSALGSSSYRTEPERPRRSSVSSCPRSICIWRKPVRGEATLTILTWKAIATFTLPAQDVLAPWLMACDILGNATYLKLKTTGQWTPPVAGSTECGPDGLTGEPFPVEQLVVAPEIEGIVLKTLRETEESGRTITDLLDADLD